MKSYFTIKELCASDTAKRLHINNTPNKEEIEHLKELISCLNGFREFLGSALYVNSGYRCPELNEAVGGAKTSGHQTGYAADVHSRKYSTEELFEKFKEYFADKPFDEILKEQSGSAEWIHFSLKSIKGLQRRKILELNV